MLVPYLRLISNFKHQEHSPIALKMRFGEGLIAAAWILKKCEMICLELKVWNDQAVAYQNGPPKDPIPDGYDKLNLQRLKGLYNGAKKVYEQIPGMRQNFQSYLEKSDVNGTLGTLKDDI